MTTLELYKKHKSGTVSRDKFLYEVRRDNNLPWVTNITSYDDAVKILKNKGIIREMDANVQIDPAVDLVNPYFLKKGVQSLLSKEKELTNDSYVNALNKAAKNLIKDPNFYEVDMFANADEIEKAAKLIGDKIASKSTQYLNEVRTESQFLIREDINHDIKICVSNTFRDSTLCYINQRLDLMQINELPIYIVDKSFSHLAIIILTNSS